MKKISEIVVDKDSNTLEWLSDAGGVHVNVAEIEQALLDEDTSRVFVLSGIGELKVFGSDGSELVTYTEPEGFQFYYLTRHPDLGFAVVCVSAAPVEGWTDWHFGINEKKKELYRYCPAY